MFIMSVIDSALAAQNLVNAAESLELGVCYIGGARNHPDALARLLELPSKVFVTFGLTIGYPLTKEEQVKPRLPQVHGILHFEKYDPDYTAALLEYEEVMREFNAGQPGREGRGWLAQTARRVGTAEALGAERPDIKKFLERAELDLL
jgi:hypothetical protein